MLGDILRKPIIAVLGAMLFMGGTVLVWRTTIISQEQARQSSAVVSLKSFVRSFYDKEKRWPSQVESLPQWREVFASRFARWRATFQLKVLENGECDFTAAVEEPSRRRWHYVITRDNKFL